MDSARHGLKVSAGSRACTRVPGCAFSVVLGVCVLGGDLRVCDRTPGNEVSEHFVILGPEL